jgi:hypothetical protein
MNPLPYLAAACVFAISGGITAVYFYDDYWPVCLFAFMGMLSVAGARLRYLLS